MRNEQFGAAVLALLALSGAVPSAEVYRNDFERPDGLTGYWSSSKREATPKGERKFLGRFGNETVTLSLKELPKHRFVQLSFDLFLMHNWRGGATHPRSNWQLSFGRGPMLVNTTFSAWPDFKQETQAYPFNEPLCENLGATGAAEFRTLGYKFDEQWGIRDAVYKMTFLVPHTADKIDLHFAAVGLVVGTPTPFTQAAWGLDNVMVETLETRPNPKPSKERLAQAWEEVGGAEAKKAHKAVWDLISGEDQTVAFLTDQILELLSPDQVKRWLQLLDSKQFRQREEAMRQLQAIAPWVREQIKEALATAESLELRRRLEQLLKSADPGASSFRRYHQALYALEMIGTEVAGKLSTHLKHKPPVK